MFLFGRVHGLDALRRRNDRGSDEGDGVGRLASFKSPTVSNHVRGLLFHSLRGGGRKALSPLDPHPPKRLPALLRLPPLLPLSTGLRSRLLGRRQVSRGNLPRGLSVLQLPPGGDTGGGERGVGECRAVRAVPESEEAASSLRSAVDEWNHPGDCYDR